MNVEMSPDLPLQAGIDGGTLALSPDGRRLVVSLRSADGRPPRNIIRRRPPLPAALAKLLAASFSKLSNSAPIAERVPK